jgi:hypothetical protein
MDFNPKITDKKVNAIKAKQRHFHFTPKTEYLKEAVVGIDCEEELEAIDFM